MEIVAWLSERNAKIGLRKAYKKKMDKQNPYLFRPSQASKLVEMVCQYFISILGISIFLDGWLFVWDQNTRRTLNDA